MGGAGGKALRDQYRSGHCATLAAALPLCARPWGEGQPAGGAHAGSMRSLWLPQCAPACARRAMRMETAGYRVAKNCPQP